MMVVCEFHVANPYDGSLKDLNRRAEMPVPERGSKLSLRPLFDDHDEYYRVLDVHHDLHRQQFSNDRDFTYNKCNVILEEL